MASGNFFSVRTTPDLMGGLREAAESRSVSINREINDRLAASFDEDRDPDRAFPSRTLFVLMKLVATAMQTAGEHALHVETGLPEPGGAQFFKNPYAYDHAMRAAITVLEACRPPGNREPSQPIHPSINELRVRLGEIWAESLLVEVAGLSQPIVPPTPGPDANRGFSIYEDNRRRAEKLGRDLDPSLLENIRAKAENIIREWSKK